MKKFLCILLCFIVFISGFLIEVQQAQAFVITLKAISGVALIAGMALVASGAMMPQNNSWIVHTASLIAHFTNETRMWLDGVLNSGAQVVTVPASVRSNIESVYQARSGITPTVGLIEIADLAFSDLIVNIETFVQNVIPTNRNIHIINDSVVATFVFEGNVWWVRKLNRATGAISNIRINTIRILSETRLEWRDPTNMVLYVITGTQYTSPIGTVINLRLPVPNSEIIRPVAQRPASIDHRVLNPVVAPITPEVITTLSPDTYSRIVDDILAQLQPTYPTAPIAPTAPEGFFEGVIFWLNALWTAITTIPVHIENIYDRIISLPVDIIAGITGIIDDIVAEIQRIIDEIIKLYNQVGTIPTGIITAINDFRAFIEQFIMDLRTGVLIQKWLIDPMIVLFIPDQDFITELINRTRSHFAWIDEITDLITSISLTRPNTPPNIYVDLNRATSEYNWGGRASILNLGWFLNFRNITDPIITAFVYLFFFYRIYLRLPDIIAGSGAMVVSANKIENYEPKKQKAGKK